MRNFIKLSILLFLLSALFLKRAKAAEEEEGREYCVLEESKFAWVLNSAIRFLQGLTCHNFKSFPKTFNKSEKVEKLSFGTDVEHVFQKRLFNIFNNLTDGVMREAFENFPNLQWVHLCDCFINKIEKRAFQGGEKLSVLALNDNNIQNLDLDIFLDVLNLEILDLSGNPLGDFQVGTQFPKMKLKSLVLNNCSLKTLEPTLLDTLVELRSLHLGNNKLVAIDNNFLTNFKNLQILRLEGNQLAGFDENIICELKYFSSLSLEDNPLSCNCNVVNLIDLLRERNIYFSEELQCSIKKTNHKDSAMVSSLCPVSGRMSLKKCDPSSDFIEGQCSALKETSGSLALYCFLYRNGLPKGLDSLVDNVTVLRMDGFEKNNLRILKNGELRKTGLSSLKDLNLGGCQIKIIERGAFSGGEKIEKLELQDNLLVNLDAGAFSDLENLYLLNLSNNPIRSFQKGSKFPPLQNLEVLLLENCKLTTLEKGIFKNFKTLQMINLKQNEMKILSNEVFHSVIPLRGCILLEGNPWICKDQFERMVSLLQDWVGNFTDYNCRGETLGCPGWAFDCLIERRLELKDLGCSKGDNGEDAASSKEVSIGDVNEIAKDSSMTPLLIAALCAAAFLIFIVVICIWKYLKKRSSIRDESEIVKVELMHLNPQIAEGEVEETELDS